MFIFPFPFFYNFVFFSFFFLLFIFASTFKPKQRKDKEKDKGIPYMMCITNDDSTRNGNKCNNVMKKKCLKREKEI
jgi:hypothetical protein